MTGPRLWLVLCALLIGASSLALINTRAGGGGRPQATSRQLSENASLQDRAFEKGRIYVQLGAFRQPEGAARLAAVLAELHYAARVLRAPDFQRVVVGPFAGEPEASRVLAFLQQQGFEGYVRDDGFQPAFGKISREPLGITAWEGDRPTISGLLIPTVGKPRVGARTETVDVSGRPRAAFDVTRERSHPTGLTPPEYLPATVREEGLYGEAARGARLLQERYCTSCHSMGSADRGLAPTLGRRPRRKVSPAGLTAMLWNHAPVVWRDASLKQSHGTAVNTAGDARHLLLLLRPALL